MQLSKPSLHTLVQVSNVSKQYHTGDLPFVALRAIELEVNEGEFLGIIGKSGAGKTTLLNMISGVSRPSSGEIHYFGTNHEIDRSNGRPVSIHDMDEDALARWRGKHLGIVYQSFELMPKLNLIENVLLPPDFAGQYHPAGSPESAMELLELLGISEHAYKIPAHISGGQKQRVAIARALINDPPLILADEPTGNLDTVTAESIIQILENLVAQGKTIVMVTHDESLAPRFSRRVQISDGELVMPSVHSLSRTDSRQSGMVQGAADPVQAMPPLVTVQPKPSARAHHDGNYRAAASIDSRGDQPAILLKSVDKVYESEAGRFVALKSIDLQLRQGQFISVVGKSGSGKSTLLNMITGIDHPSAGEVIVGNRDIYKMSESERARWRGRNVGVVFQFFQLLPTLSLLENTMLPMDYCDVYPFSERPQRAMELLKLVGLEQQAHQLPASLSSGQQQGAAIARSLATDPPIILADEPTGNLDSRSAKVILSLFDRLAEDGKTILIVTHDSEITRRTDQTIILSDGEIVDQAVARALPFLTHPQMLAASHQAKKLVYAPTATILKQGDPVDHFFMVSQGEVDVVLRNGSCDEIRLARLGAGQFFGEVELTHGGDSVASVRASAEGPVELALLRRDEFFRLIDGSPLTRNMMREVADLRRSENQRAREREC